MKVTNRIVASLFGLGIGISYAQISKFDHIIIVVQENRTPDNLFYGLCSSPGDCSTKPTGNQYNIQTANWLDNQAPGGVIQPQSVPLANNYDIDHSHSGFNKMCNTKTPPSGPCQMGGVNDPNQFHYVDNSTGILNPYLNLARKYTFANYMFQTNQGPSFPAHQFLFGGTSAPTAGDDQAGTFASENICVEDGTGVCKHTKGGTGMAAGCAAPANNKVQLIHSPGVETIGDVIPPCFDHDTMADALGTTLKWRYYAPNPKSIWTAPNAITKICEAQGGKCTGAQWKAHVDAVNPSDVLQDILNCKLPAVSWVIPTGQNSDHANDNDGGGPSWVASVVNAVGESSACDANGYWNNTAIVITWDDWGGWYDHEPPPILSGTDYQYGFRVPLMFVSAYSPGPKGRAINTNPLDFGSILRFVEGNFGIPEGVLNFADARAKYNLQDFYDLSQKPRPYQHVAAPLDAQFFLNDKRVAKDPDDQ